MNAARQQAIETARQVLARNPVFLDTETTGLDQRAQIVEIAVIDSNGAVLSDKLVRPTVVIPPDVIRVHHITNEMVADQKSWVAVWPEVRGVLFNRLVAIYNEEFDLRMMQQTHRQSGLEWKERLQTICVMKLYARFRGEWDPRRRSYRYFSLDDAGKQCGIPLPNSHRAADDCQLTRALLQAMAEAN
jgi:DNA polymerase-3 subunit epsilon